MVSSKLGTTTGLECQGENDELCSSKQNIVEKLAGMVIPLSDSQFFDMPNPARNLIGYLAFQNNIWSTVASSGSVLLREHNLNVGYNCKKEKFDKQFEKN